MEAARTTLDPVARREAFIAAERVLAEEVVLIPLVTREVGSSVAYRADEVAGLQPGPMLGPARGGETWRIERWYRVDT